MSVHTQRFEAVPPLAFTAYATDGRVIFRKLGLRVGGSVKVPPHLRKKVARTETMDRRGRIVARWSAPWPVEPMETP